MATDLDGRLSALGTSRADIDERFVRGGGPGGQKINKTSSTVWLRHRPTGTEVRCQRERSQAANRELAWEEMCARLERRDSERRAAEADLAARASRRVRQKSRGQKARMVDSKKLRARSKAGRARVAPDD
jgi:protein subunit release factor B